MKKLFLLTILLLAPLASAQESYTLSYNAPQVARLDKLRVALNESVCRSVVLPAACTQAEACVAAGAAGGAACTANQAQAANVRIYGDSQSEREAMVKRQAEERFRALERQFLKEPDAKTVCDWFTNTATAPERATFCTNAGLPSDCDPCP